MKNYLKKQHQLNVYFVFFLFIMLIFGVVFVINTWKNAVIDNTEMAVSNAKIAENSVSHVDLSFLLINPYDVKSEQYTKVKQGLESVVKADKRIRFAYIYVLKNNNIYFLVDSEPATSADYSPPMQEYVEATADDKSPFKTGEPIVTKPTTDRWGNWVSALVPIKDQATGKVIAVLGLDYPMNLWYKDATVRSFYAGLVVLVMFLLLIAFFIVLKRSMELNLEKGELEKAQAEVASINKQLEIMNENFNNFFDSINDLIFVLNISGNIVYANATAYNRLGYSESDLIGKSVLFVHPENKREEAQQIVAEMVAGERDFCPIPLLTKNGKEIDVETRIVMGRWDGEDALFGVVKDISALKKSEEKFAKAFHSNAALMAISRISDGLYFDVNETFLKTLGFIRSEVVGKRSADLNIFSDISTRDRIKDSVVSDNYLPKNVEVSVKDKQGNLHYGLFSVDMMELGGEQCWLTTMTDITEQKMIEEKLILKQKMLKAISESTNKFLIERKIEDAISEGLRVLGEATGVERTYFFKADSDENGNFDTFSQVLEWNSGFAEPQINNPELQNVPVKGFKEFMGNLLNNLPYNRLVNEITEETTKQILVSQSIVSILVIPIFVHKKFWGFIGFDECKYERLWEEDDIAILRAFANAISGAVAQDNYQEKIKFLSNHDQLTGLFNRRYYETIVRKFDDEKYLPLSLVMADVNGLKLTNDAFGHLVGDELLKKISEILQRECRANDIVARIGGDEFVLLLPRTDEESAKKIIHRISQEVLDQKMENVILSLSLGHAVRNSLEESHDDIFMKAEDNMYRQKLSESASMRSKTIDLIMNSLLAKNVREMNHSKRVGAICEQIAKSMNFSEDDVKQIRLAGLMHDIGKIGIDEKILNKHARLDNDEWSEIQRHSEIGYRILSSVNEFSEIADYVLEHHERWDGRGYPKGLSGEQILLQARIIQLADSFDAMISSRAYKDAIVEDDAIREIVRNSGVQFDPEISRIFVEKVLKKNWDDFK